MVCTHGQGGGGSIFLDLVRTSFMNSPLGYFKMTILLVLNLKKLSFLKCLKRFQLRIFFKWLAQKATGDEKSCSPTHVLLLQWWTRQEVKSKHTSKVKFKRPSLPITQFIVSTPFISANVPKGRGVHLENHWSKWLNYIFSVQTFIAL